MARSPKTPKFDAFNAYEHCFGELQTNQGTWQDYLDTSRPLILEVGCARANLLMELARNNPHNNYIGIDRRSDRLYFPARDSIDESLKNIAFIQMDTRQIMDYFNPESVNEIWLTFPDPYPRDKHEKNRMSGGKFLQLFIELLKPGGLYHFKTDNDELFAWSLEEIKKVSNKLQLDFKTNNLHAEEGYDDAKIVTVYEKKFLQEGLKTKYLTATKLSK